MTSSAVALVRTRVHALFLMVLTCRAVGRVVSCSAFCACRACRGTEPIDDELLLALIEISSDKDLAARLRPLLDPLEIRAFQARAERLVDVGHFPDLNPRRNVPYGW